MAAFALVYGDLAAARLRASVGAEPLPNDAAWRDKYVRAHEREFDN